MATRKRDRVYWVIQKRSKMFQWQAFSLFKTQQAAEDRKTILTNQGGTYKIDRVVLED